MSVVHLGSKLQAGQSLGQVRLKWTDHDEHQGLGVATQRELEKVGKLDGDQ